MALTLYKRHVKSCTVHQSSLPARARRHYWECKCPIWIYGRTATSMVPRQSTGFIDKAEAEALVKSLEAEGKSEEVHGPKLANCVEEYLLSAKDQIEEDTLYLNRLGLERFRDFCHKQGKFFIREVTVDLLESYKTHGLTGYASSTRAYKFEKVRTLMNEAFRRGWITDPRVTKVKTTTVERVQTDPFSDDEVTAILDAAQKINPKRYWTGPTYRLLLELLLETGMRVGDAISYDPKSVDKGERLWVYNFEPQKQPRKRTKKRLDAFISNRLKKAIDECEWISDEFPFKTGSSNVKVLVWNVRARLRAVGKRCGINDCHPHRFRDTFAVRQLLRGLQIQDLSRLLGHSSVQVTELYYAKWVPSRIRRLERLLTDPGVDTQSDTFGD